MAAADNKTRGGVSVFYFYCVVAHINTARTATTRGRPRAGTHARPLSAPRPFGAFMCASISAAPAFQASRRHRKRRDAVARFLVRLGNTKCSRQSWRPIRWTRQPS